MFSTIFSVEPTAIGVVAPREISTEANPPGEQGASTSTGND